MYQIVDEADVTEPIDLADQKIFSGIDVDYSVPNSDILTAIAAARQRLEAHLNIGLVKREIIVQWNGCTLELPLSPTGDITYVKKEADTLSTDDYVISSYRAKTISIKDVVGSNFNYFYDINGGYVEVTNISGSNADMCAMYEVKYSTGYETLPQGLRLAIMAQADAIIKLKGMAPSALVSPNAALLSNPWNRNLVL